MYLNPALEPAHRRALALLALLPPYARRRHWGDEPRGEVLALPQPDDSYRIEWSTPCRPSAARLSVTCPPGGGDDYRWEWRDGKGRVRGGAGKLGAALDRGLAEALAEMHGVPAPRARLLAYGRG